MTPSINTSGIPAKVVRNFHLPAIIDAVNSRQNHETDRNDDKRKYVEEITTLVLPERNVISVSKNASIYICMYDIEEW